MNFRGKRYRAIFEQCLQDLDEVLSRSAQGVLDSSVSNLKRIIPKKESSALVAENRNLVCHLIFANQKIAVNQKTCEQVVTDIARQTLANFGVPLLREWDTPYSESSRVSNQDLPHEMEMFYGEITDLVNANLGVDPAENAAWAEYRLNAELHPFYDGCSRISRYVAAWILARSWRLPPLFESRAQYWVEVGKGRSSFVRFYSSRVEISESERRSFT